MPDRLSEIGSSLNRIEGSQSVVIEHLDNIGNAMLASQDADLKNHEQHDTIIELLDRLNRAVEAEPEESELPELLNNILIYLQRLEAALADLPKKFAAMVREAP